MTSRYSFHYSLTLIVTLVIAVLSLMPGSSFPSVAIPHVDLLIHLLLYIGLVFSFCIDFTRCGYKIIPIKSFWWIPIVAFVLGGLFELLQLITETRSASWLDLLANAVGIIIGGVLFWKIYIRQRNKKNG